MPISPSDPCRVCPHTRREHVMHGGTAKDWKGDYCTECQRWCKEVKTR